MTGRAPSSRPQRATCGQKARTTLSCSIPASPITSELHARVFTLKVGASNPSWTTTLTLIDRAAAARQASKAPSVIYQRYRDGQQIVTNCILLAMLPVVNNLPAWGVER
jgi:hypothetical protein